jgi:hypothetical protein
MGVLPVSKAFRTMALVTLTRDIRHLVLLHIYHG